MHPNLSQEYYSGTRGILAAVNEASKHDMNYRANGLETGYGNYSTHIKLALLVVMKVQALYKY